MTALIIITACFLTGFIIGWGIWAMTSDAGPDKWEFPWQTLKRQADERHEEERERRLVGTIRIVEKLNNESEPYYTVEIFDLSYDPLGSPRHRLQWRPYITDPPIEHQRRPWFDISPLATRFDTSELAQAAANKKFDEDAEAKQRSTEWRKRENYKKVMGTFRPGAQR